MTNAAHTEHCFVCGKHHDVVPVGPIKFMGCENIPEKYRNGIAINQTDWETTMTKPPQAMTNAELDVSQLHVDNVELNREIDSLREQLAEAKNSLGFWGRSAGRLSVKNKTLREQNARYREALVRLADPNNWSTIRQEDRDGMVDCIKFFDSGYDDAMDVARAALKEDGECEHQFNWQEIGGACVKCGWK